MTLPNFDLSASKISKSFTFLPEPIFRNLFDIESDLPEVITENIFGYNLDVNTKTFELLVNLNEDTIGIMSEPTSIESIKIKNHDRFGNVIFETDLETLTNPSGLSLSGDYSSDELLFGKLIFRFGAFYQELKNISK